MAVNAWQSTSNLLKILAQNGWGVLDVREAQGIRRVLTGLSQIPKTKGTLKHFNQQGNLRTTAWQVGNAAGMSERWARIILQRLEAMGIITWQRGKIWAGKPTCSILRVSKKALVELIKLAKKKLSEAEEARRDAFKIRIAAICKKRNNLKPEYLFLSTKGVSVKAEKKNACLNHPELSASLSKRNRELQTNPEEFDLSVKCSGGVDYVFNSPGGAVKPIDRLNAGSQPAGERSGLVLEPSALPGGGLVTAKEFDCDGLGDKDNDDSDAGFGGRGYCNGGSDRASASGLVRHLYETEEITGTEEDEGEDSMLYPKIPSVDLTKLPVECPHGNYDPLQCGDCLDAARDPREMKMYREYLANSPSLAKYQAYLDNLKAKNEKNEAPQEWFAQALRIAKNEGHTAMPARIKRATQIVKYWQSQKQGELAL